MKAQKATSPAKPLLKPPSDLAEEAFRRVRPELDASDDVELGRITANVTTMVLIILGALPNLEALRKEIERLPGQTPGLLDKLRDYAYALMHVHALSLPSSDGETRLAALLAEAAPLRERMLSTAELFAKLGLFDAELVAAIRSGNGHADTANDLLSLARLFRGRWPEIEGKVPVTRDEVERAGALGVELIGALGQRKVGTDGVSATGEYERARVRLFHLAVRAYDQMVRAAVYLRWNEGDADALLPSLFQGRPRRRRAVETPPEPAPPAPDGPEGPGGLDEA